MLLNILYTTCIILLVFGLTVIYPAWSVYGRPITGDINRLCIELIKLAHSNNHITLNNLDKSMLHFSGEIYQGLGHLNNRFHIYIAKPSLLAPILFPYRINDFGLVLRGSKLHKTIKQVYIDLQKADKSIVKITKKDFLLDYVENMN